MDDQEGVTMPAKEKKEQAALVQVIGNRLREARELCNLSQIEAARRLGYANSSGLAKLERATDVRSVPLWVIQRAARIYDVSLDYLFGASDDWEVGARMTIERETSAWLHEAWERARRRDMDTLRRLHDRVEVLQASVATMLSVANELEAAMARFIELNPTFEEDMPGGAKLLRSVRRVSGSACGAQAKLARFRIECQLAACGSTSQLSLSL